MQNTDRGNYWALIIWADNIEQHPDWKEKLIATFIRMCISPYHDKDVWSNDDIIRHPDMEEYIKEHLGEQKKPHYHVLIHCDANTTFKTMKDLISSLDIGTKYPILIRAPYGYYHYLTHDYNPEKAQYDCNDIKHYNGSEPGDYLMEISKAETVQIKSRLRKAIQKAGCLSFGDMEDVAESIDNPNYLYVFQNNVNYFKNYLVDNLNKKGKYRDPEKK